MLDLDAAFAKLRNNQDQEERDRQDRKNRTDEAIRNAASACQKSFGDHGKVEVRREAKGIFLDAGANGWMSIKFDDVSDFTIRIGKKRSGSIPPEVAIPEYQLNDYDKLGDAIAQWYTTLPNPR